MPNEINTKGQRYSLIYLRQEPLLEDCPLLRNRLSAFLENNYTGKNTQFKFDLIKKINEEIGLDVPSIGNGFYSFKEFFRINKTLYILDTITIVYHCLKSIDGGRVNSPSKSWLNFVKRSFKEQNLGYALDEEGGVHRCIDEEFERNRYSALKSLEKQRYAAANKEFEDCYKKLTGIVPDTKGAIEDIFECVEIIFKLIANGKASKLSSSEIETHLPKVLKIIYPDPDHSTGVMQHLKVLKSWADANHYQRHGQAVEQPRNPPMEFAIMVVSVGASLARWLIEIDENYAVLN